MADITKLSPKIIKWEGGYVNDPNDHGGATNMGITLTAWQSIGHDLDGDGIITVNDIKLLTPEHFIIVLKIYWDYWMADKIDNQSVAEILVDWVYNSGQSTIKTVQRMLSVDDDGHVGMKTITALNDQNQETFHHQIKSARFNFIDEIVRRKPEQARFEGGWKSRISSYNFSQVST